MKKLLSVIFMVSIAGCASMSAPSSSLIDTVPVVKVGEISNIPKEHIVFIPANSDLPIEFSVNGSVFNQDVSLKVITSFKYDIY